MLKVQCMKPFYTKVMGSKMHLIFAYQYFSIVKDNEAFRFIPIEGQKIVVNLDTMQVENLSDIFVFENGDRFIRLPLYQLLLVTDIHERLSEIILTTIDEGHQPSEKLDNLQDESMQLINEIEQLYLMRLIDEALDRRDEQLFIELCNMLPVLN